MSRPLAGGACDPTHEGDKAPESLESAAVNGITNADAAPCDTALTEAGGATVAALLHLLRLMGAELVLMRPGCDSADFERAVRTKIGQFTSPTTNPQARKAGLAHAQHLVEQVLLQIRAQAELRNSLAAASSRRPQSCTASTTPYPSRSLN